MSGGQGSHCWVRPRCLCGCTGGQAASRAGWARRPILSSHGLSVELNLSFIQHVLTEHLLCAEHYNCTGKTARNEHTQACSCSPGLTRGPGMCN